MAFLKGAPLSVIILTRLPYLHMMSLNSHCLIDLAFSSHRALDSIYDDRLHLPCTIYLHPFDGGFMCTVFICSTWNIDGVWVITRGISRAYLCLIWHKWHVLTYHVASSSISGYQNLCWSSLPVAYAPLCPMSSWQALSRCICFSSATTNCKLLFLRFFLYSLPSVFI